MPNQEEIRRLVYLVENMTDSMLLILSNRHATEARLSAELDVLRRRVYNLDHELERVFAEWEGAETPS